MLLGLFVMEQAISLEQTNALRISLGLRPITIESKEDSEDVKAWKQREKETERAAAAASAQARIEEMEDRIRHRKATKLEPKSSNSNWLEKVKAKKEPKEPAEKEPELPVTIGPKPEAPALPKDSKIEAPTLPKAPKPKIKVPKVEPPVENDRFDSTFDPLNTEDRQVCQVDSDFKKAKFKTKKRKSTNRRIIEQEDYNLPVSFSIDDEEEDLHKILAENRKVQLEIQAPEEIAKQVKESTPDAQPKEGVVVSSTTDFLVSMRKKAKETSQPVVEPVVEAPEEPVVVEEAAPEKELVSGGLAATLNLLKSKGVVKSENNHKKRKNKEWLQKVATQRLMRDFELRQQKESIEHLPSKQQSEYLEAQDKQNVQEELELAKRQFKDYQPTVEIEHRDDQGNLLDPKQAFKHLSHKFHGNSEGRKRAMKRKSYADATKEEMAKPLFD